MKITDLIISPESLGKRFWLTTVTKIVEYKDNKPTENILGYRYIVALPDRNLDKIAIRIDGTQKMEQPQTGFIEVNFQNLEIFIFGNT